MELKPGYGNGGGGVILRFNRTSVELKLAYISLSGLLHIGFNRTSVELKHLSQVAESAHYGGLIVPVWN